MVISTFEKQIDLGSNHQQQLKLLSSRITNLHEMVQTLRYLTIGLFLFMALFFFAASALIPILLLVKR